MEEPRVGRILHPPGETIEERVNRLYRENKILGDLASDLALILGSFNSSPEALKKRAKEMFDKAKMVDVLPERVSRKIRDRVAHVLDDWGAHEIKREIMRELRDLRKKTDWSVEK